MRSRHDSDVQAHVYYIVYCQTNTLPYEIEKRREQKSDAIKIPLKLDFISWTIGAKRKYFHVNRLISF